MGSDDTVREQTAERLRIVVARLNRSLRYLPQAHSLTPSQMEVLVVLARRGPGRLADLAATVAINPTMLSRIAAKLEEMGLAERSVDATDARVVHLAPTLAATKLVESIRAERRDALQESLRHLSVTQLRQIEESLDGLEELARHVRDGHE